MVFAGLARIGVGGTGVVLPPFWRGCFAWNLWQALYDRNGTFVFPSFFPLRLHKAKK
jgi:hypothetical protein